MSNETKVLHAYTRKQAIQDGVLIDVGSIAKEAGFRVPVALTAVVYEQVIRVPEGVACQDETGRLWDVLMCCLVAGYGKRLASEVRFDVLVRFERLKKVPLKAICGPDDDGRPCVTIMLPEED